ncbi:MAG: hypothetical protein ACLP50_15850 [Solirubrobacteraceae bacterium]
MKRIIVVAAVTVGIGLTVNHALKPGQDLKTQQTRDAEIARQYEEAHKRDLRNYKLSGEAAANDADVAIGDDIENAASKDLVP